MSLSSRSRFERTRVAFFLAFLLGAACGKNEESSPPVVPVAPSPESHPLSVGQQTQPTAQEPAQAGPPLAIEDKIRAALAGAHREEEARARDAARHPLEVLSFFGLRDDMVVLELAPGTGWYTAVLAPILRERGKLFVTNIDPTGGPAEKYPWSVATKFEERLKAHPDVYAAVGVVRVSKDDYAKNWAPSGSVDLVVTFRNLHNWVGAGTAEKFLKEAHRVLKPRGVLGVVDHRATPGSDPKKTAKQGYVAEDFVIRLVEAQGFALEAKSEINANPRDTKDYPEGVWTLPPTLELGEKDREKYIAIGESDRMTLKFVKR